MKVALVTLLFTVSALAQPPLTNPRSACGREDTDFKVKLDDSQHTVTQPEAGKARVYLIHDAGTGSLFAYPTTKLAVDGAWVGANHGNSYLAVSIEPGEHHLCATLQSSVVEDRVELAHFTAEAGKVYYYRTRLVMSKEVELLELDSIDSDQGQYLVASFPLSVSTPKKKSGGEQPRQKYRYGTQPPSK